MARILDADRSCIWFEENSKIDSRFKAWDPTLSKCSKCSAGAPDECVRSDEISDMILLCVQRRSKPEHRQRPARERRQPQKLADIESFVHATGENYNKSYKQSTTTEKETDGYSQLMSPRDKENGPSVIRTHRVRFPASTPSKYDGTKRGRELGEVASYGLDQLSANLLPNMSTPKRRTVMATALDKQNKKANKKAIQQNKQRKKKSNVTEANDRSKIMNGGTEYDNEEHLRSVSDTMTQVLQARAFAAMIPCLIVQKPKERRPIMAAITQSMTREDAELMMETEISPYEWQQARKHNLWPGPTKPVEKIVHRRCRFKVDELVDFIATLKDEHLQHHAYGMGEYQTASGAWIPMDAISTTVDNRQIMRDCAAAEAKETENSNVENRCGCICNKSTRRCLLSKDHEKNCVFTPSGGISCSSIHRILKKLTNGPIKNLAGLDGEDTIKGSRNIKRLHEIWSIISADLRLPQHEIEKMDQCIDDCHIFHITDFKKHVSREGKKICQCASCGFSTPDLDASSTQSTMNNVAMCSGEGGTNDLQEQNTTAVDESGIDDTNEGESVDNDAKPPPAQLTDDDIAAMGVKELKAELKERGHKVSGKKAELQIRLKEVISGNLGSGSTNSTSRRSSKKKRSSKKNTKKACYDNECIPCKYRNNEALSHEGPCDDCEKSFQIFSDLLKLLQRAKDLPGLSPPEKEKYSELDVEIRKCRRNLIDWRSHIVRKKTESDYTREMLCSLGPNEAMVQSDFKMKLLPMWFREIQTEFFGKRGTSCLGFMILTNPDGCEGEIDVNFVLLFSDDTYQDAGFVLAGKNYIYNELLPTLFSDDIGTIDVHFESDGAGCYNTSVLKACMPMWYEWTEGRVEEVESRHSVCGGGKSELDGVFGKVGGLLWDAVRNGGGNFDIHNAATCLAAFESGPGIRATKAARFRPIRGQKLKNDMTFLTHFHKLVLDRKNEEIRCFRTSGYGIGVPISLEDIDEGWNSSPELPEYFISTQHPTFKSEQIVSKSTESKSSRVKKAKMAHLTAKTEARKEKMAADHLAVFNRGLYKCQEMEDCGVDQCRSEFTTKGGLERHKKSGNHDFPSKTLLDTAACIVSHADGIFRLNSNPNRSEVHGDHCLLDGSGAGVSEGKDWYSTGCYLKPGKAKPTKKSPKLVEELEMMFDAGEASDGEDKLGKQKYTGQQAQEKLQAMKQPSGLLMFSATSEHGAIPSIEQIKQFWTRLRTKKAAVNAKRAKAKKAVTSAKRADADPEEVTGEEAGPEEVTEEEADPEEVTGEAYDEWAASILDPNVPQYNELGNCSTHDDIVSAAASHDQPSLSTSLNRLPEANIPNSNVQQSFAILKPGVDGAVDESFLHGKRFLTTGVFPQSGCRGESEDAAGVANIEAMIKSFGGIIMKRMARSTNYLLVGKYPAGSKLDNATKYSAEIISLHRLERLLLGNISFDVLKELPAMGRDMFIGENYQAYNRTESTDVGPVFKGGGSEENDVEA